MRLRPVCFGPVGGPKKNALKKKIKKDYYDDQEGITPTVPAKKIDGKEKEEGAATIDGLG